MAGSQTEILSFGDSKTYNHYKKLQEEGDWYKYDLADSDL